MRNDDRKKCETSQFAESVVSYMRSVVGRIFGTVEFVAWCGRLNELWMMSEAVTEKMNWHIVVEVVVPVGYFKRLERLW